jgi:hypothetical protein
MRIVVCLAAAREGSPGISGCGFQGSGVRLSAAAGGPLGVVGFG